MRSEKMKGEKGRDRKKKRKRKKKSKIDSIRKKEDTRCEKRQR